MQVPAIIEFVKMRAELHELHRIHRHLSRERELQKIMLRLNRQNYKNII
jgi:3-polyprenyl-4-hydroxybenzoate decarboxylase